MPLIIPSTSPIIPDSSQTKTQVQSIQSKERSPSPPAFSPITPKAQPVIPAAAEPVPIPPATVDSNPPPAEQGNESKENTLPPTQFVPEPAPKPFSSADSIDGLALKAAISSLQFQKQKAQDDIKSLDKLKRLALADPERFAQELAAGRLKEQRHQFGNLQDIADAHDADDSADEENAQDKFPPIPGAQNVVRMPYVNWDKYHVLGEPLETLHEQQRRWPGSAPFQQGQGRDFAVMAPYSPFQDGPQQHSRNASDSSRKDSIAATSAVATPTAIEHPYETRKSSKPHG